MKKLIWLFLFWTSIVLGADIKISQLPLGTASSTGVNDSFPYVVSSTLVTKRMTVWDLINVPTMVSTYAPKASPTFTGVVTSPSFVGALTGNASTATALAANPTDCSSNTYATTIAANGNLTCASITNASTTAASANTASAIVARDGSGNFTAGTITAALTGNASTATALAANPSDCAADTYATTIAASGNLTCATVTNAGLAGSIAASKLVGSDIATVGTITSGTWSGTTIAVNKGGTGLTSGTSGGVPYYSASGTIASSGALSASQLVIGGGAGAAPTSLAAGTVNHVLTMGASNPGYAALPTASYLAQTSNTKTPTASGNYAQMTNGKVTLTAGQWMLSGAVQFNTSGSAGYTFLSAYWTAANGADNGTPPTALTVDAGLTQFFITFTAEYYAPMPIVRVTVASTQDVYIIPNPAMSTPANSRLTTYIYAQKLSN